VLQHSFSPPRWLFVPGLAIFGVSAAAVLLIGRAVGFDPYDLGVYLMGGDTWRHGLPVYDQSVTSQWGQGYFTYPPATLLVFGPLSALPPGVVHAIMAGAGVLSIGAVVWLVLRALGARPGAGLIGLVLGVTGAALWLQPVYDSLQQGQINPMLMLLVVADLAARDRHRWTNGIGIGIATAAKITPGIFIVYLLITRRFRAAATAAATWAAVTAAGFVAAPGDSAQFWLHGTFFDSERVSMPLTPASVYNQSLHGAALRLLGTSGGTVVWAVVALVVGVAGMWAAAVIARAYAYIAGGLVAAVTGLLISPLSWHEHWIWIVPVVVVLAYAVWPARDRSPFLLPALPVLAGIGFLMWPLPGNADRDLVPASILSPAHHLWEGEGNHNPVVALAASAYVLVGLALLALAAGTAWRVRRTSPGVPQSRSAEPTVAAGSAV
jgi:alpha-1,2-mannosyltransferase